jgi:GH25 family lysozyme M1 (1,4-beta-N-acetylmuramidase)
MRLPDDDKSKKNMSPAVFSATLGVALFMGTLVVAVLLMNGQGNGTRGGGAAQVVSGQEESSAAENAGSTSREKTVNSPEDLDFWDMYPEETENQPTAEPETKPQETPSQADPATDGRHTLIQYRDGSEEWVLISPYLPKNTYDYTNLVSKSGMMEYFVKGRQTSYLGVSISKNDDYVDFVKVRKAGIDFVMLRVGARGYGSGQLMLDENFLDNIKRATDAGLRVGVYFFSQAITTEEVTEEANLVLENIQDYEISYPVAFDMEYVDNDTARVEALNKEEKTKIAITFMDVIKAAGYIPMLYGDKEWLIKRVDLTKLKDYDVWLSQPGDIPDYPYQFTMWQYDDNASVSGIAQRTNLSISFIDYGEK